MNDFIVGWKIKELKLINYVNFLNTQSLRTVLLDRRSQLHEFAGGGINFD